MKHLITEKKKWILASAVGLALVALSISWWNYRLHFNGFPLNDYHEYCQIARNMYEGNGYSTSVLRPISYQFFQTLPQPEVTRMPGYPWVLSFFFTLLGVSDEAVIVCNSLFFALLLVMVFLVAYELSSSIITGIVAALMTASMESFLYFTLTAEPNIFYAALFMAFIYFYLKYPEQHIIQGVILGLLYTVRANTLFVIMGFLAAELLNGNKWPERIRNAVVLGAGCVIGLMPYMIRNYMVIGKPLFSLYSYSLLLYTKGYPAYTVWTQLTRVDPAGYLLQHPAEVIEKSLMFLKSLISSSIPFYKPTVLAMVVAGLFAPLQDPRLRRLRFIVVTGVVVQTILVLPLGPVPYYYMFFFPVMIAVGLTNAQKIAGRFSPAIAAVALLIVTVSSVPYWKAGKPGNPFISIGEQVRQTTGREDIILTDIPWEIAWYGNRRAVWLPYDLDTLARISKTLKPRYLILAGASYAAYKDNIWKRMLTDTNFALENGFVVRPPLRFLGQTIAVVYEAKN